MGYDATNIPKTLDRLEAACTRLRDSLDKVGEALALGRAPGDVDESKDTYGWGHLVTAM